MEEQDVNRIITILHRNEFLYLKTSQMKTMLKSINKCKMIVKYAKGSFGFMPTWVKANSKPKGLNPKELPALMTRIT